MNLGGIRMIVTFTIDLWWPLVIIASYYLIGLLLSLPMLLLWVSYPRPEWGRSLVGWLLVAWFMPIVHCRALFRRD